MLSMSPILFDVLGFISGVFFVIAGIALIAFLFVRAAIKNIDGHAEDVRHLKEQEHLRK